MENSPAPSVRNPRPVKGALLLVCGCVVICGGCFTAKRPAPSLGPVTFAHPVAPHPPETTLDEPEIFVEESEPIPPLALPRRVPAKPRVAAASTREPVATEEPSEPILAPELSDQQVSSARAGIEQSLSVAERNVNLTQGKTLNAAQQDLVSKIRDFIDSAREAMQNSDWQRAQIQAKKAEVLSQEFAPKQ
jgi:hypothetical protein